jgi:hypothetical protein
MLRILAAVLVVAALAPAGALAATPQPNTPPPPSASGSPCFRTLKFAGALYLDADTAVSESEVGAQVGTTDPNPAQCGLPDRLPVYRHNGHSSSDEVVYRLDGRPELFRSAGSTGFPLSGVLPWLVLLLVIGVLLFGVAPALMGHMRRPPIGFGGGPSETEEKPPGST